MAAEWQPEVGRYLLIISQSGIIGYPTFQSNGMSFKTLFNPNIRLGGQIQMQSSVGNAATAANNPNVPGWHTDGRAIGIVACAAAAGS